MKEMLFDLSAKLMVLNTGLFHSNKQTVMNAFFIKNFKKGRKKDLKFRKFTVPGYSSGKFCSLIYLMKIRLVVLLSVPVLQEVFPEILL